MLGKQAPAVHRGDRHVTKKKPVIMRPSRSLSPRTGLSQRDRGMIGIVVEDSCPQWLHKGVLNRRDDRGPAHEAHPPSGESSQKPSLAGDTHLLLLDHAPCQRQQKSL